MKTKFTPRRSIAPGRDGCRPSVSRQTAEYDVCAAVRLVLKRGVIESSPHDYRDRGGFMPPTGT